MVPKDLRVHANWLSYVTMAKYYVTMVMIQVTRVYYEKFYIEVEWTVGPIPLDHGREIISRYETSLDTNNTFYTDSNGGFL